MVMVVVMVMVMGDGRMVDGDRDGNDNEDR
jgi:hypothetical protein